MVKKSDPEVTSSVDKKERKPVVAMVPLFNWRTMLAVAIGLIIGAGLGLGYWIYSPSLSFSATQSQAGSGGVTGMLHSVGPSPTDVPWTSRINVQVVNPGSAYMSLRELENKGEYYAAKANSLPFLEFLSRELGEQAPEYSHTPDELDQIVRVRYDPNALSRTSAIDSESENPAIEVKVTGASAQEALFLTKFVPQAFESYLIAEENDQLKQEYQNTLKEIETVKVALYEAETEMSAFGSPEVTSDIQNDPTYIALNAKIESLETELDRQALNLSFMIAGGDATEAINRQQQEYEEILQKGRELSIALTKAKQELRAMEKQWAESHDVSNTPEYIEIKAKISALEFQLNLQMTELATLIAEDASYASQRTVAKSVERTSKAIAEAQQKLTRMEEQESEESLADDLDYQLTQAKVDTLNMQLTALQDKLASLDFVEIVGNHQTQQDAQAAFKRTSSALAEARKELALLDSLEAQTGNVSLMENVDYRLAQAKADTLNRELAGLTDKLSLLLADSAKSSEITDYLVAGNPSMPTPVLPERMRARNALIMGAIVGIGGAWVILNFRWIAKGMPSSSTAKPEEDEEDVA